MDVFISWSGQRSKIFASLFHDFIERLLHPIKPWMSSKDIEKGKKWGIEIGDKLSHNQFGIICVTPENQNSPWLMFEAGAISKTLSESRVFPVLIGMEAKDLVSPLNQYQATIVNRDEIYQLLKALNNQMSELKVKEGILKEEFELKWEPFNKNLQSQLNEFQFKSSSEIFPQILKALSSNGIPSPETGNTVHFKHGFESHAVYESAFRNVKRRLFIFGRKNRKVFDKEHWWFFQQLNEKISVGLDFRCLFLDPDSPSEVLSEAHQDHDFKIQLEEAVSTANEVLDRFKIDRKDIIKFYNKPRAFSMLIIDDAILFKAIEYEYNGKAKRLTRSSFTLTSTLTDMGRTLENNYESVWQISTAP